MKGYLQMNINGFKSYLNKERNKNKLKNFKGIPASKIHEMVHRSWIYKASLLFGLALMVVIAKSFLRLSQHTSQTPSFVLKCCKSLL